MRPSESWESVNSAGASVELTAEEIRQYYRVRVPNLRGKGKELRAPCPVHRGERDSFSVNLETGLAFCHSQCDKGWNPIALEMALGDADSAQAERDVARIVGRISASKRIECCYDYKDASGNLVYQVVRQFPKDFKVRRPNGSGGWIWNLRGVPRILYNLLEVIPASKVYLVEGEKDAETLRNWGLVATTNSGGAKKWDVVFNSSLVGKEVVFVPDQDQAGREHRDIVLASLRASGIVVRVVDLPCKDVTEWKERHGGTKEQLEALSELVACDAHNPSTLAGIENRGPLQMFRSRPDGLYRIRDRDELWICAPVEVVALVRDSGSDHWGKEVRFKDRDGMEHSLVLSEEALAGQKSEFALRLVRSGLAISPDPRAIRFLREFLTYSNPSARTRQVETMGWHDSGRVFVTPGWTIPPKPREPFRLKDGYEPSHSFARSGNLGDWQREVGRKSCGNALLQFGLCTGFAPILLKLQRGLGGGYHLSSDSTTGKSTTLIVAGSVWGGGGRNGFCESWKMTTAAAEFIAALHNCSLLCLDELAQMPQPERAGEMAYFFANGHPAARMTRELQGRRGVPFELIFLSSGEFGFLELIRRHSVRAYTGQEVRVVEIPADRGRFGSFDELHGAASPAAFAEGVSSSALRYYGTAAPAFIERFLQEDPTALTRLVQSEVDRFVERNAGPGTAKEVRRILQRIALSAVAGELATRWGILPWKEGEASSAVASVYDWVIQSRGTSGSRLTKDALEHFRHHVRTYRESHFVRYGKGDRPAIEKCNRIDGYIGEFKDGRIEYQFPGGIPPTVCGPFSQSVLMHALEEIDALEIDADGHRSKKRHLPGYPDSPRCVIVRHDRLFSD